MSHREADEEANVERRSRRHRQPRRPEVEARFENGETVSERVSTDEFRAEERVLTPPESLGAGFAHTEAEGTEFSPAEMNPVVTVAPADGQAPGRLDLPDFETISAEAPAVVTTDEHVDTAGPKDGGELEWSGPLRKTFTK